LAKRLGTRRHAASGGGAGKGMDVTGHGKCRIGRVLSATARGAGVEREGGNG